MSEKYCNLCPHVSHEKNFARHMRMVSQSDHSILARPDKRTEAPHVLVCPADWCALHVDFNRAEKYATKSAGWLKCGCKQRLRIGTSADWWTTLTVARGSLTLQLADQPGEEWEAEEPEAEEPQAEMSSEDESEHGNELAVLQILTLNGQVQQPDLPAEHELAGNKTEVVDDVAASPAEGGLAGNESEVVEYDEDFDDFATLLAKLDVVGNKTEDQSRFRLRGYGSLPAVGAYSSNPSLPPRFITLPGPVDPELLNSLVCQQRAEEDRQRQLQQQDNSVPADEGAREIATWDKALFGRRVTSIACTASCRRIRPLAGLQDRTRSLTVRMSMASLLANRHADHPLVLFLRGQSDSGKTWLTRKLLEPLEGADISITSFEGGAATRTIPPPDDKRRAVKLTKRLLDEMPKWSKTAQTAANESSSRAVVGYRMDGLLWIDMPGDEVVRERPQETKMISATNMAVLATLDDFHNTGKATKVSTTPVSNRAAEFFLNTRRIPGVRVLVATVLRDTDVSNPKALAPLQDRFQGQRSQQR
ncbi:hypothetical protein FN846DRAFT_886245 [Sphaerosporella brunnea]|uniref:Uncharacterized protein n=1 Tax=Sphaerosporella brunnea TaxID=1250544 RepID=A0A5J5FA18_9PEZI|nr:hypothetical protein FN846DRAFT_886245 [Sphaerosporella brunnea]